MLRANISIRTLESQIPWPLNPFYINLLFKTKGLQLPSRAEIVEDFVYISTDTSS